MVPVPLIPLPPDATKEQRTALFLEWADRFVDANPGYFLPIGVRKRWWMIGKMEHPRTKYQ